MECPPELNLRFRFYHIWKLFEINGVLSFNLYAELTSHLQICRKAMESNQIRENGGILDECTRRALLQVMCENVVDIAFVYNEFVADGNSDIN